MKRAITEEEEDPAISEDKKMKKIKPRGEEVERKGEEWPEEKDGAKGDKVDSVLQDENLLYEVLKHADARTLGTAACVSKQWHKTAQDERLWELICTRHWANVGCGNQQLRSVVLALGGFRRLHTLYLLPLSKPSSSSSSASSWPCLPTPVVPVMPAAANSKAKWGKDEVNLSLSLLSIRYYEKMNFNKRGK